MNDLWIACREIAEGGGHEAGRLLLEELYRERTGEALPEIAVTDRGKPYFTGSAYHFSISHTKKHVFCALGNMPVGIDAEELDRKISLLLADKILSPGEYAQYQASRDKRRALLTFWVMKEAQAKATGEGLRGYPCNTDFSLEDPRAFEQNGCLVAVITR